MPIKFTRIFLGLLTQTLFGRNFGRVRCMNWRIGCGILPINFNLFARISSRDPYCPLCQLEEETNAHIFFHCQATKMFWFGLCWGFRPDLIPITSNIDIVKLVVDPHVCIAPPNVSKKISFQASCQFALTLEGI